MPVRDPSTTSNGVTLLAVFLTLLVILTFLYLFKLLFTKSRRFWFKNLDAFPSESSLAKTSAQVFTKIPKYQPGFLIGLLGSPTWETSTTISIHKIVHEQQQSFFAPESPQCINHSDFKLSSEAIWSNRAGHGRLPSMSSFGQGLEPSFWSSKPVLATPTPPPPVICGNARITSKRRYSLPSIASSDVQHGQMRRSFSTRAKRGNYRGSDIESIFFSPRTPIVNRDRCGDRVSTQPLSRSPCLGTSEMETKTATDSSRALSPGTTVNMLSNTPHKRINEASLGSTPSVSISGPLPPYNFTMNYPVSRADCQSPLLSSQARNLVSPLVFDAVESAMHIDTFNGPALPPNPVAMFKLRPKNRTPSRTKRSPPLGPSPLRTMILPECFDSDLGSTVRLNGLDGMNTEKGTARFGSLDQENVSRLPNPAAEGRNSDSLLGLIRELVEEVNDWDDSLYMDKNFKTMLEKSQDIPLMNTYPTPSSVPDIEQSLKNDVFGNDGKSILQSRNLNLQDPSLISGGGQLISFWNKDDPDRDDIGIAQ